MAVVFQRRLAMPVWAVAFFAVALAAPQTARLFQIPPATAFAMALGIATIVFLIPSAMTRLRTFRPLVRVVPSEHPGLARTRSMVAASSGVRKLYESDATYADDALALVRMDDDGGRQMARPPS